MKYSFLVAVYNVEDYLIKCLNSLLAQDYSSMDYEIILVDDGSTDCSSVICDQYAALHTQIKVIHQNNCGLMQARRAGAEAAIGEYLVYIDSDDYVDESLLSVVDAYIRTYCPDFLMYGHYRKKDDTVTPICLSEKVCSIFSQEDMLKGIIRSNKYNGIAGGKVVRSEIVKDHIEEIYNHCVNIGEDKLQTAFLIKYSNKMIVIPECLYYYVIRDNSMIHGKEIYDLYDAINMYDSFRLVTKDIIENNTNLSEERETLLMDLATNSVQGVLEHIYKYDIRDDYGMRDKANNIDVLLSDNKTFFFRTIRKSQLKVYNRFRLWLLMHFNGKALVRFDCMIHHLRF